MGHGQLTQSYVVAKPHQEEVHFKDYIWRMAINYRRLNQVTKPFQHPIRQYDDAVQDLGDARFLLSIDLDSGFHQVSVHADSQSKLDFFGVQMVGSTALLVCIFAKLMLLQTLSA
jgi:hypothetical protein